MQINIPKRIDIDEHLKELPTIARTITSNKFRLGIGRALARAAKDKRLPNPKQSNRHTEV